MGCGRLFFTATNHFMLKEKQIVRYEGREHRVAMVNDCRALLIPLSKKEVTIKLVNGEVLQFTKAEAGVSVSPESELQVIGRWKPNKRSTLPPFHQELLNL